MNSLFFSRKGAKAQCLSLRFIILLSSLFIFPFSLDAQTTTDAPYLIPQIIFVGDRGRFVVPVGRAFARVEAFVWDKPEMLPQTPDLVIHRIELERQGTGSRFLIDFTPYAPGALSIPPIEFPSQDVSLLGLEVQVASILDSSLSEIASQMALTEPAPPLAVPGTSLLVYGTLTLLLFLLAMGIVASFWSRRHLKDFLERLRRKLLLKKMMRFLRRLNQECHLEASSSLVNSRERNTNANANADADADAYACVGDACVGIGDACVGDAPAIYLMRLSTEFREFLSLFTGVNCRSFTPGEFLLAPSYSLLPAPSSLCDLFRSWDILRFSGRGIEMDDLFAAIVETENLVSAIDKAEKEAPLSGEPLREEALERA